MDELIKTVSQKTGLSQEQAKQAAEAVLSFLKSKLPAPVAGQIDGVLSGKGPDLGAAAGALGGMFGKK
jgi:uncharacterized protein (DUF2267 family)